MDGFVVQSRESATSTTGTSIALAFSLPNTAHNGLWAVGHIGQSTVSPTVADSLTNSFSATLDSVVDNDFNNLVAHWAAVDCLAGANIVTISFASAPFLAIYIAEIGGIYNVAVDAHNGQHQLNPATSADAVSSNTATVSASAFLIGLSCQDFAAGNAPTKGTGFSLDRNGWIFGANPNEMTVEYQAGVAPGTRAATFTAISGADDMNTIFAAFKEKLAPPPQIESMGFGRSRARYGM